jgi:hypothetical protein
MSSTFTAADIDALLEQVDKEMSPLQVAADANLQRFENGCSETLRAHITRYCAEPSYAAQVNAESVARVRQVISLSRG